MGTLKSKKLALQKILLREQKQATDWDKIFAKNQIFVQNLQQCSNRGENPT